ncbi:uncharacterized protein [Primulina eburnea]|uniref:uncharacterized protein n=1 Tax=Primulina eburnea TaxID=1245227 RepID=UPI003C6C2F34
MATRVPGSLPSETKKNPKGVNAVIVTSPMKQEVADVEENVKEKGSSKQEPEDARKAGKFLNSNPTVDINSLPFPQRVNQLQPDTQFSKFLEIFKKMHINITSAEALAQMPSYAKFLKEIISNMRKLVDFETVKLSEECSAILQNKLPPKAKDPCSFSIPCTIGNSLFGKALCDLGANINLMPYSCFEKLGIGEVKLTTISLQLADRSIKYPKGVVEDVYGEDREIPLILGRQFLATGKALIDVHKGELVLRLNDKSVVFNVFQSIKYPNDTSDCFRIDATDELVEYGTEEENLLQVLKDNIKAIGWSIADIKGISSSMCMHKILMEADHKTSTQHQRRLNPAMQEVVKKVVIKLLDTCIIYPISDSRLAGHPFYCFLDGYSGYMQILIDLEDQEKITFTCPYGTFAYKRMPFGLCNAPATFKRCMMAIFHDMIEDFIEIFMNDFSVFGSSFDTCLINLSKVLERCEESNLVLNWEKCHFMVREGIVLGHKISETGIEVDKAKIEVIEKLPAPSKIRGVRSFLGHAGLYRRFIKDFSCIASPLTNLLIKDVRFDFSDECVQAFQVLKDKLITAPVMIAPDWGSPFEVMCDANDTALEQC